MRSLSRFPQKIRSYNLKINHLGLLGGKNKFWLIIPDNKFNEYYFKKIQIPQNVTENVDK